MHILAGLSRGSCQSGAQQLLTLWWALEEELHGGRQQGQLHLVLLVGKAQGTLFQQVGRILHPPHKQFSAVNKLAVQCVNKLK